MGGRAARLDRVLDALAHANRRRLLVTLARRDGDDDVDPREALSDGLGSAADDEVLPVELWHRHLPKLDAFGFVAWDRSAGTVARGPAWADVEPVLELLDGDGLSGTSTTAEPPGGTG